MTNEEYKTALAELGFSRREWAALIGSVPRAVQNRADGTSRVSGLEELMLRLLLIRPELVPVIEELRHAPREKQK